MADQVSVGANMVFGAGFAAVGETRLQGAHIGGDLSLTGGRFTNPAGEAVSAHGARIAGRLVAGPGFKACGTVGLASAQIGLHLQLDGDLGEHASIALLGGISLQATDAHVGGNVTLGQHFSTVGQVCLVGADIKGRVDLNGARLHSDSEAAFNGSDFQVGGSFVVRSKCDVQGGIHLARARIGSDLKMSGSTIRPAMGVAALDADGLTVAGSVDLAADLDAPMDVKRRRGVPGARFGRGG